MINHLVLKALSSVRTGLSSRIGVLDKSEFSWKGNEAFAFASEMVDVEPGVIDRKDPNTLGFEVIIEGVNVLFVMVFTLGTSTIYISTCGKYKIQVVLD